LQEAVGEHGIGEGAFVDVEPDLFLEILVALVDKEYVHANLLVRGGGCAGGGFVTVLHGERFTIPPSGAFRD
jgi:hypothetical protein